MVKETWKKVGTDFAPNIFLAEGKEVIGVLKEKKDIKDKETGKDRKVYTLDVEGDFIDTKEIKHTGVGTLWGSGMLDKKMESVEVGTKIKVVYLGKEVVEIDGKKRKCNQHEVYTA